ncbi:flagellar hook-basal body protein [Sphingomonas koreensis]
MSGLVESALAILTGSGDRARVASDNIGNMTTPGYKARIVFGGPILNNLNAPPGAEDVRTNFAQGPLRATGHKLDLAIQGEGFFIIASQTGQAHYTRQGQFRRDEDGRLVTAAGHVLQQADGGDLIVRNDRVDITADGTVLDEGQAVGRIAVAIRDDGTALVPVSGSIFAAPESGMLEAENASIRQGMLEGANVSLGDEMLTLMTATRQAEAGARLVQVYDELMGRAFTTLGQRG